MITQSTLISYGDTLAKINFSKLIANHEKSKCVITIVAAPIQNPFGLVNWNSKGKVIKFKEKAFDHNQRESRKNKKEDLS